MTLPFKNLSTYGWISAVIIGMLIAVFNGIGAMNEFYFISVGYSNDDDFVTCESGGGYFYAATQWYISLSNGICFPSLYSGASSSPLYTKLPNGDYCIAWDATYNGVKIYDDNAGYAYDACQTYGNMGLIVDCEDFGTRATGYKSSASAAKAAIAFGVISLLVAIVGTFFAFQKSGQVKMFQAGAGAFFLLTALMNLITFGSNSGVNPFTNANNNIAFGCPGAGLSGNYFGFTAPARGFYLSLASVIMSITMGGLCLTTNFCDNRCCCPCCFAIAETETAAPTATAGAAKTNGGVVGVQV